MARVATPPPVQPPHSTADISVLHSDILENHILTRLGGATLASAACASSQLCSLVSNSSLWTSICHSTWPSTDCARLRRVISDFPCGHRSFFADSYTDPSVPGNPQPNSHRPPELISAVDIYYKDDAFFSKVIETEMKSGWFNCSPFRVDFLEPKEAVVTLIPWPETEVSCRELEADVTLSWIVIDPAGRRAMNVSSFRPASVQRHWLSGEVQVKFATVLGGERATATEFVNCAVVITCEGRGGGKVHVREVCLQMEDMDGMFLNGRDSLDILHRALRGKRGKGGRREKEAKVTLEEFMERKRERRERQVRTEEALDKLCVAFGVLAFACFGSILLFT